MLSTVTYWVILRLALEPKPAMVTDQSQVAVLTLASSVTTSRTPSLQSKHAEADTEPTWYKGSRPSAALTGGNHHYPAVKLYGNKSLQLSGQESWV